MRHSSVNATLANPNASECAIDWSRLADPALMEDLFQAPTPVVNTSETQSHRGSKLQICNLHRSPDLSFRYSLNKNRLSSHCFQTLGQCQWWMSTMSQGCISGCRLQTYTLYSTGLKTLEKPRAQNPAQATMSPSISSTVHACEPALTVNTVPLIIRGE